jgi:hypothetical protein
MVADDLVVCPMAPDGGRFGLTIDRLYDCERSLSTVRGDLVPMAKMTGR